MPCYRVNFGLPGIYLAGHPKGQQVVDHLDVQTSSPDEAVAHVRMVVLWPPQQAPIQPITLTPVLLEA